MTAGSHPDPQLLATRLRPRLPQLLGLLLLLTHPAVVGHVACGGGVGQGAAGAGLTRALVLVRRAADLGALAAGLRQLWLDHPARPPLHGAKRQLLQASTEACRQARLLVVNRTWTFHGALCSKGTAPGGGHSSSAS